MEISTYNCCNLSVGAVLNALFATNGVREE